MHSMNTDSTNQVPQQVLRKGGQLPPVFRWFSGQCVLRQIDAADVPRIWKAVLHPAYERCWTVSIPHSEPEVAALVATAQADWRRGSRYVMAVQRRQTHEFIGWVEARRHERGAMPGVWTLDWFLHPSFVASSLALEALSAAADLMMNALDARLLRASCPAGHGHFEQLLRAAGFSEHVPAGSLDPDNARPRAQALHVMTRRDWARLRGAQSAAAPQTLGGYTVPKLELSLL
jgi:RimJ/RimL family protein N-acetyltransferase